MYFGAAAYTNHILQTYDNIDTFDFLQKSKNDHFNIFFNNN